MRRRGAVRQGQSIINSAAHHVGGGQGGNGRCPVLATEQYPGPLLAALGHRYGRCTGKTLIIKAYRSQ